MKTYLFRKVTIENNVRREGFRAIHAADERQARFTAPLGDAWELVGSADPGMTAEAVSTINLAPATRDFETVHEELAKLKRERPKIPAEAPSVLREAVTWMDSLTESEKRKSGFRWPMADELLGLAHILEEAATP